MTRRALFTAATVIGLAGALGCARHDRWSILLVTFDTTRADHIGCYGAAGDPTPHVDRLAAEGTLFENAMSAVPITAPSHTTILTGRYPVAHGMRDNGLFVLDPGQVTLAERLRDAGYGTAAAVGSFPLASRFGLDQGFDLYDDRFESGKEALNAALNMPAGGVFFDERRAGLVNEPLLDWLGEHGDRPFFVWAHYFDPHHPHLPPRPFSELWAADSYQGEIAYADEAFGQLLAKLEAIGAADRTIVVFTADHGEGLGDHGELTHSTLAYNATLHVPLVIRIPGAEGGRRVAARVGTVDIVPTLLDLVGLPITEDLQGSSLLPLMDRDTAQRDRTLYAETLAPRLSHGLGELRALFEGRYKYIHGPRPELFDLQADPGENDNLVDRLPGVAASMRGHLAETIDRLAETGGATAISLDDETRRRLEALGYLHREASSQPRVVEERLRDDGLAPQDRVGDINELSLAKELLAADSTLEAEAAIETLLRRDPENPSYLRLRLQAQFSLGRLDEALETMRALADQGTGEVPLEPLLLAVEYLATAGREPEALALLEPREDDDPTALGQWTLASLYRRMQRQEEAASALARALAIDPDFAPARVDQAVGLASAGDLEAAEKELRAAIVQRPYYAKAHFNLGTLLGQEGDGRGALAAFDRATVIEPGYAMAHYAATLTAAGLGERAAAVEHLGALEELVPESDEARWARQAVEEIP